MLNHHTKSPSQEINSALLEKQRISLFIKRDDLLHPLISGNKWRKLRYNILSAREQDHDTLLTFGGAYSNHIYSTAAAAFENGFKSIGVIRGDAHSPLNPTLQFASEKGMQLYYVDRASYRNKTDPAFIERLKKRFGRFYLIPEGGTNALAIQGCVEIVNEISTSYDYICCSVGTGGTLSGLIAGLQGRKKVLGFSALKGDFLTGDVAKLIADYQQATYSNWKVNTDYHFGGYAKISTELIDFIKRFKTQHGILLDPVYTGKMMFGLFELIEQKYFEPGTKIIALHTGGLQGWKGIEERYGIAIS